MLISMRRADVLARRRYVAYAMESFRLLLVPPNDKVV